MGRKGTASLRRSALRWLPASSREKLLPTWQVNVATVSGESHSFTGLNPADKLHTFCEKVSAVLGLPADGIVLSLGERAFSRSTEGGRSLRALGVTNGVLLSCVRRVTYQEALAGTKHRWEFYKVFGTPDQCVIEPLIGPRLGGCPAWPTRPAWRCVHGEGSLVVASDGLSDPWDPAKEGPDAPLAGFGMEVFMGSADLSKMAVLFAVTAVSHTVAGEGGTAMLNELEQIDCVSVEIPGQAFFPQEFVSPEGTVGILMGSFGTFGAPDHISLPTGQVRLVELVALHPQELAAIQNSGAVARNEIYRRLKAISMAAGSRRWLSSGSRHSVVPAEVDVNEKQLADATRTWPLASPDTFWN